jgi:hypothetical protein
LSNSDKPPCLAIALEIARNDFRRGNVASPHILNCKILTPTRTLVNGLIVYVFVFPNPDAASRYVKCWRWDFETLCKAKLLRAPKMKWHVPFFAPFSSSFLLLFFSSSLTDPHHLAAFFLAFARISTAMFNRRPLVANKSDVRMPRVGILRD